MIYFPITLTVTLTASLFVEMVVNAAMTGGSMDIEDRNVTLKSAKRYTLILGIVGIIFVIIGNINDSKFARGIGHFAIISLGLMWLYKWKMYQWTQDFQHSFFPRLEEKYKRFLSKILVGRNAWLALVGIIGMLFLSVALLNVFPRKILFFPENIPNQVITYIEYPQGTDIEKTNKANLFVEKQVIAILSKYVENDENYLAESIVSQVGKGAGNPGNWWPPLSTQCHTSRHGRATTPVCAGCPCPGR
jgi:multidrug efflux pump subunit AcrB